MLTSIEWVLFDWGNVLVDYRPLGLAKLAQRLGTELATLSQFVSETGWIRQLTLGALSPEAAIEQLAKQFGAGLGIAQP
jgi:hypothetical protein